MNIDPSAVDWARAQFALTAIYHWLFVPLTLGLALVMGIMETYYYRTKNDFWKRLRSHVKEYIGYLKDEPSTGAQEVYNKLQEVMGMTEQVKIDKFNYKSWRTLEDTSYLNPLLEFLQQEYERRGHQRIVPRY